MTMPQAQADEPLSLPVAGTMVNLSPAYMPVMIKGLKVHPDNPLLFDFILDTGKSGLNINSSDFKTESHKLIKYFLASLTIKEDDLWVNLSPYEKDRMIPPELGKTELGRDMLAQDYLLKQLTASLIYPEKELGKKFWDNVYTKARQMYGVTDIPVNTFNKVWIVADKAKVLERNNAAYIVGSHLKVMLEEDYLALKKNYSPPLVGGVRGGGNDSHALASQIIRQIILPELEKEVNQGQNFAPLRQMFYSMILASWYKLALKDALLNQVYSNKAKTSGVLSDDTFAKEKIYQQYLKAYKKGVFNYIKEDIDAVSQQPIPRKYFSGGLQMFAASPAQLVERVQRATPEELAGIISGGNFAMVSVQAARKFGPSEVTTITADHRGTAADIATEEMSAAVRRYWVKVENLRRIEARAEDYRSHGGVRAPDGYLSQARRKLDSARYEVEAKAQILVNLGGALSPSVEGIIGHRVVQRSSGLSLTGNNGRPRDAAMTTEPSSNPEADQLLVWVSSRLDEIAPEGIPAVDRDLVANYYGRMVDEGLNFVRPMIPELSSAGLRALQEALNLYTMRHDAAMKIDIHDSTLKAVQDVLKDLFSEGVQVSARVLKNALGQKLRAQKFKTQKMVGQELEGREHPFVSSVKEGIHGIGENPLIVQPGKEPLAVSSKALDDLQADKHWMIFTVKLETSKKKLIFLALVPRRTAAELVVKAVSAAVGKYKKRARLLRLEGIDPSTAPQKLDSARSEVVVMAQILVNLGEPLSVLGESLSADVQAIIGHSVERSLMAERVEVQKRGQEVNRIKVFDANGVSRVVIPITGTSLWVKLGSYSNLTQDDFVNLNVAAAGWSKSQDAAMTADNSNLSPKVAGIVDDIKSLIELFNTHENRMFNFHNFRPSLAETIRDKIQPILTAINNLSQMELDEFKAQLSNPQGEISLARERAKVILSTYRGTDPRFGGRVTAFVKKMNQLSNEGRAKVKGQKSPDQAMDAVPGGIDLSAKNMALDVSKDGQGVAMKFDPAMVEEFQKGNFTGVEGIILRIVPIQSPLPILGLATAGLKN